jgi:tetratricopeptide (TPR) repeat protein
MAQQKTRVQPSSHATDSVRPEARAWFLKGLDYITRGLKLDAARCFYQAVRDQPGYVDAHFNLGLALQELGQLAEACACYEQVVRLRSEHAAAWNNLGVAQKQIGRWQKAVESQRKAVGLEPGRPDFQNNLANALRAGDQVQEAIQILQDAIKASPASAELWHTLGNALREAGRLAESRAAFNRALEIEPLLVESHWDLAFTLLLQGELPNGWKEYEWRWKRKDHAARTFASPAWLGEDLRGKRLLVYAEQGAGDTIQFARYLPLLVQRGAQVILECPRHLVSLLQTIPGLENVIARGDALPPVDLQCALLSLPLLFRTTLGSIPTNVPYLRSRSDGPRLPSPVRAATRRQLRVGLAWSGNPAHQNDSRRSIALELLQPLLANDEVTFYSLQPQSKTVAENPGKRDHWLVDLSSLIVDYADTAALLSQLDLVISVDTSVAHLAGALGHPVWLLLPYAPDWRWLMHRSDSPWYQSMRLFRQPVAGDWKPVIKEIGESLSTFQPQYVH